MTFAEAMSSVVATTAPLMKAAGFNKRRYAFNRQVRDGLVHHLSFQMGAFDPPAADAAAAIATTGLPWLAGLNSIADIISQFEESGVEHLGLNPAGAPTRSARCSGRSWRSPTICRRSSCTSGWARRSGVVACGPAPPSTRSCMPRSPGPAPPPNPSRGCSAHSSGSEARLPGSATSRCATRWFR